VNQQENAMDIVAFGTPFGLAFASGLNAYLPLLAFALSVRWSHLYTVNPQFALITHTWFIAVLAILTLLDFVADKIPLIDHLWNAMHAVVRPIAGAAVAVAASGHALAVARTLVVTDHAGLGSALVAFSPFPVAAVGLLVILIIGGVLAALSHTTKSTARLVSTLTTAGFLNIALSLGEDILVFIIIFLSLFASSIMLILLVIFVLVLAPRYMRTRNTWTRIRRHWRM
jgi:Domain of unknown function (DUF4126)